MKATYIDHMGTDLSVVNAARVSFSKTSEWFDDSTKKLSAADKGLIQFLARGCAKQDWDDLIADTLCEGHHWELDYTNEFHQYLKRLTNMPTHWTPFGHTAVTLHMKAPIFIARQLGKHQVGMVWNEVSRRYITDDPTFYRPEVWRKAADNVKQGSSEEGVDWNTIPSNLPATLEEEALSIYKLMLEEGVCPEQARIILPQSMYTEWYWTGNLYSFANVFIQRSDRHAQYECQVIADMIAKEVAPLFPVSWEALTES